MARNRGRKHGADDYQDEGIEKSGFSGIKIKKLTFKSERQRIAAQQIEDNELTFLIGSAGTGKSFLPVYFAFKALIDGSVRKIIFARPAVEAGESIGFLPGGVDEKLDPYMRPLIDIAEDLIGQELFAELRLGGYIEFCPIGYLRGRTFNDTFIVLDEMQNAKHEQLKLALTRIGENSKCVVTADPSQIDLEYHEDSSINDFQYFRNRDGIGFVVFKQSDVMRSKVVKLVLECYNNTNT